MPNFYFTVTSGRTGTTWLAEFIKLNLDIVSIHEPPLEDLGEQLPDVQTLKTFNNKGFDELVRGFWQRKFSTLTDYDDYCETNHTLAKCGLLEHASTLLDEHRFCFFLLRRSHVKQCASFLYRGDFNKMSVIWQWLLDFNYRSKIVDPQGFLRYGQIGHVLWYVNEI